jgi:Rrf2 family transcriptional regulator, cysteine metabolism repressor
MRVSSRADYGVRALVDLAERFGTGPVQSREIASRQSVPEAYLHQVLGALSRAGLIRSTRGPQGGHELVRPPAEVSVWDIISVLDGPDRKAHPHAGSEGAAEVVHDVWHELQEHTETYLRSISLEDLIDRASTRSPAGTYAI